MKRALIDPSGRIAQVEAVDFPVAAPFFWVDCPDGCTPEAWCYAPAIGCIPAQPTRAEQIAQIERERDASCVANVIANGRTWQADQRSQALLGQAITLAGAGLPLPTVWRDADNQDIPVASLADLLAIAGAIADHVQAAYSASWAAKASLP